MQIKPMLAKPYEQKLFVPGSFVQPKLNGVRCLYQNGRMVSRDGHLWAPSTLCHIRQTLEAVELHNNILDGELYVHGMSLQNINSRCAVMRVEPHADEAVIEFHVFDYISREPMVQRVVKLASLFKDTAALSSGPVKLVPTFLCRSLHSLDRFHDRFKREGFEGTMVRHPQKPYAIPGEHPRKDNRVSWLLKRKDWLDLDALIVRVVEGEDGFAGTMGSFELDYNGKRFFAGSGPTHDERAEYWANRHRFTGMRCKVQFEMLSDSGTPLKPVIIQVELP